MHPWGLEGTCSYILGLYPLYSLTINSKRVEESTSSTRLEFMPILTPEKEAQFEVYGEPTRIFKPRERGAIGGFWKPQESVLLVSMWVLFEANLPLSGSRRRIRPVHGSTYRICRRDSSVFQAATVSSPGRRPS